MEYTEIVVARSWRPVSLFIQICTLSWWSHTGGLDRENGVVLESRGGIGCTATPIEDFKKRYTHWQVRLLPVQSRQTAMATWWDFVKRKVKYDLKMSFAWWLRTNEIHSKTKVSCSEFIAAGTGYCPEPHRITPEILRRISKPSDQPL